MSIFYVMSSHRDVSNLVVDEVITTSFDWLTILNKSSMKHESLVQATSNSTQILKIIKPELETKKIEFVVLEDDALMLNMTSFESCTLAFLNSKFDKSVGQGNNDKSVGQGNSEVVGNSVESLDLEIDDSDSVSEGDA